MTDDAAVLDLDPARQPVGEPERARGVQRAEVVDAVRRRVVVRAEAEVEGQAWQAADRLRRDPGEHGHR